VSTARLDSHLKRLNTMILHPDDTLPFSSREVELWAKQWWEEGEKYQSFLAIGLEEPLTPGDHIWVDNYLLDSLLRHEDHQSGGIVLIDEYLTRDTCNRLSVALDHIKNAQGISCQDAMGYLILSYTWYIDINRKCEEKKSILFRGRYDQDNACDAPPLESYYVDVSKEDIDSDYRRSDSRRAAIWS
jgi:hypothetical protein